jgi:transposase InsO family protein
MQQGQVLELKKRAVDGSPLWAYRYRTDIPSSRRLQRGGFSSERDAAEALERALERLRRQKGVGSTVTLHKLLDTRRWKTRFELANAIFEYIEIFHNRRRRHSSLGMRTPIEYELLNTTQAAA